MLNNWKIFKDYSIDSNANWYEHDPEPVTEGNDVTILWDFTIHTDRTIQANQPDIVIKDKENNTCFLIDMSVPSDRNISVKVFEKLSKYDLQFQSKTWKLKMRKCGA